MVEGRNAKDEEPVGKIRGALQLTDAIMTKCPGHLGASVYHDLRRWMKYGRSSDMGSLQCRCNEYKSLNYSKEKVGFFGLEDSIVDLAFCEAFADLF